MSDIVKQPQKNGGKQQLTARTKSHSDVADSPAARAYQAAQTERSFGEAIVRALRESAGELRLRNLEEQWLPEADGYVHELRADYEVEAATL
ncbi:MAG: hypothetical protein ACK47B_14865 [Armatimonadota bacterium]